MRAARARILAAVGWFPMAAVVAAGTAVLAWKLRIVAPIQYVGHADASGYAEMADSILHGRGLEVDYISWYFRKYDRRILRPEDHWPPFYSFLIVPFFAVMGKTALAAKLPSLLVSSLAFPFVVFALAGHVVRSRAVAFAAAVSILLYRPVFGWSLHCLSDVTFGFLVTAALLCAVKGYDNSWWFLPMGAFLAFSYYAKGSSLVVVPAFVGYHVLWRVLARPARRWTRRDQRFLMGLGVLLLLLLPWFVRNMAHFGDPLYTTQSHAAGYIGWKPWEEGTYPLYWGENPPSLADKLRQPQMLLRKTNEFLGRQAWWLFVAMGRRWGDFPANDISTWWTGLPAAAGLTLFAASGVYGLLLRAWRRRAGRKRRRRVWQVARRAARPEYGLFLMVALAHVAFLSAFWEPLDRLMSPVIPVVMVMGWATVWTLVRAAVAWTRRSQFVAGVVVLALLGVWVRHERADLLNARANSGYPWREADQGWMDVGRWVRRNAPGSVTMTRNPWELHFYSEEKAIQIPLAPLERVIEVARYYGATHLIPEQRRPALEPWVAGEAPGLRKVVEAHGVALYEIDYRAIPGALIRRGRQ
jgi:hypothetical protein